MILNDKYELMNILGSGKTSEVYLTKPLNDPNNLVAIKIIRQNLTSSSEIWEQADLEIRLHREIKHGNVVKILDSGTNGVIVK